MAAVIIAFGSCGGTNLWKHDLHNSTLQSILLILHNLEQNSHVVAKVAVALYK